MTHSLHRIGDQQELKGDYVFLCTPANGINNERSRSKLLKILDIILDLEPVNIGFYGYGSIYNDIDIEKVKRELHDTSRLRCCFDDIGKLTNVVKRINEMDLGLSITVSGPIDEIFKMSEQLELSPHTINLSCGIFGKTELLPEKEQLELSTMCGHGMISHSLTNATIQKIKNGDMSIDQAITIMGQPCSCGIFNPTRARKILLRITQ